MIPDLNRPTSYFIDHLRSLALAMRASVLRGLHAEDPDKLSQATGDRGGDTIYRLDEHGESALLDYCARWGAELPFLLVAEGLEEGGQPFPAGTDRLRLAFTLIVDPIDGTRGLMYGKRSAWALFGVAPAPRGWRYCLNTGGYHGGPAGGIADGPRGAGGRALGGGAAKAFREETHDLRSADVTSFVPASQPRRYSLHRRLSRR